MIGGPQESASWTQHDHTVALINELSDRRPLSYPKTWFLARRVVVEAVAAVLGYVCRSGSPGCRPGC